MPPASPGKKRGEALWEAAPTTLTRTDVFTLLYGPSGSGRTTLALAAPDPIAFVHSSEKIEGIIQPFAKEKEIRVHDFGTEVDLRESRVKVQKKAGPAWDLFCEVVLDASTWARTLIVDTCTDAWELCRMAEFGKVTQVKPIHYTVVNSEWLLLMRTLKKVETLNVILIAKETEVYRNDKPTGRMVADTMKRTINVADVAVRTWRGSGNPKAKSPVARSQSRGFGLTIEKGWWNAEVEGVELEGADCDWETVMAMVTEGEWGG